MKAYYSQSSGKRWIQCYKYYEFLNKVIYRYLETRLFKDSSSENTY